MRPHLPSKFDVTYREPKLRVMMLQKVAPYNSGEERGLPERIAIECCIRGICMPAPSRGPNDHLGGWELTPEEKRQQRKFARGANV